MPEHCTTPGGLQVYGDTDCAAWSKREHCLSGGQAFWYIEVTDGEPTPGNAGNTDCSLRTTWIQRGTEAYFHEMMHVRDYCATPNHEGWDAPGAQRDQYLAAERACQ